MPSFHQSSKKMAPPWRHPSELALVRDWLFPHHLPQDPYSEPPADMRQHAINLIEMWQFKDPKLAHPIVATAALTDAILHDIPSRRESISDLALRSIYAMAFCRFVNGLVDRDVAKASHAALVLTATTTSTNRLVNSSAADGATTPTSRSESSMYAHAQTIGLPSSFVELRHQATHDEMPSLSMLRDMARRALEWLWERWWKGNATGDAGWALRDREERRLVAESKRQTRGVAAQQVGEPAVKPRSQIGMDASMDQHEFVCVKCRQRKRRRDEEEPSSGADDDENIPSEQHRSGNVPRKRVREDLSTDELRLFSIVNQQENG